MRYKRFDFFEKERYEYLLEQLKECINNEIYKEIKTYYDKAIIDIKEKQKNWD